MTLLDLMSEILIGRRSTQGSECLIGKKRVNVCAQNLDGELIITEVKSYLLFEISFRNFAKSFN